MTDQIRAPWTPEQVAALNRFQQRGGMHPFTCGGDHAPGSPALIAYTDGWRCQQPYGESCDYRQDWAHAFMADPDAWPKFPFGERHGPTPEESRAAMLVQVGWYCWRCRAVNAQACRSDNVPVHVPAEWADEMRAEIARREDEDDGDEARTTPDNAAASRDTADNPLRERIAAALSTLTVLGGAPPARLVPVIRWGAGEVTRIVDWRPLEALLDHLEGAIDAALDIGEEQAWCKTCRRVWDGPRHRCESDAEQQLAELRAAHLRDQAALTRIRLHIAAHRQRLQYADPILLAKVDAVLREVGELEAAGGGAA